MVLAVFERDYPDELRADFQQYYGLNIDGMGEDYTFAHAAVLAAQLPSGSRTFREINVDLEWDDATYFLSQIEHDLRLLIWQKSKDAKYKRNQPKPPKLPRELKRERQRGQNFDRDLINKVLGEMPKEG